MRAHAGVCKEKKSDAGDPQGKVIRTARQRLRNSEFGFRNEHSGLHSELRSSKNLASHPRADRYPSFLSEAKNLPDM